MSQSSRSSSPPPEIGPRLVFFTGGSALRDVSHALLRRTHNSVHLMTPFDSGGSTAALRAAFNMPAVGDIRNRMLALADNEIVPEQVLEACNFRLPATGERESLLQELYALGSSRHSIWTGVPRVFGEVLRLHLQYFLEAMPADFDPRCASVGNLVLAGGYLHYRGELGPVLTFMSRLLHVRGVILPIVEQSLHLAARLENGEIITGQHRLTCRGGQSLPAPVRKLFLTVYSSSERVRPQEQPPVCCPRVSPQAVMYLRAADCICYPMGSFYTSVLANLLPAGVGRAVADALCPKVFIPNSGYDPEQGELSVARRVEILLDTLRADAGDVPAQALLDRVLVDCRHGQYSGGIDIDGILAQGIAVEDIPFVDPDDPCRHIPEMVAAALPACQ